MKLTLNTQKNYKNFTWTCHFYLKERGLERLKSLLPTHMTKNEYVAQVKNFKQTLSHGLILKNFHRAISFNQSEWLKTIHCREKWIKAESNK